MPLAHRTSRHRVHPPQSVSLAAGLARRPGGKARVFPAASRARAGRSVTAQRDQVETWVDEGGAGGAVPR